MDIFLYCCLNICISKIEVEVCVFHLRLWLAFLMTLPEYFVVILDKLLF